MTEEEKDSFIDSLRAANKAFDVAWTIAVSAHEGQTKRDGTPYIKHIRNVVLYIWDKEYRKPCDVYPGSTFWNKLIVAALHDAWEDNYDTFTPEVIINLLQTNTTQLTPKGLKDIEKALRAITKSPNPKPYDEYIMDILEDEIARPVKIGDIIDNMNNYDCSKTYKANYELSLAVLQFKFQNKPKQNGHTEVNSSTQDKPSIFYSA